MHNIPGDWGTAVNVQAMVFGNLGSSSATGVAFTRNPSTGEAELYGEFLVNAQGEDVVAGIRTPQSITEAARIVSGSDKPSMEKLMPEAFAEFTAICKRLETHYQDMQDLEFTIERGTLWMLQTRNGKRTTRAAMKIAVDMVEEGLISEDEAVCRIEPSSLDQLLHRRLIRISPGPLSAPVCRLHPVLQRVRLSLRQKRPLPQKRKVGASFWCASKPAPKTFTVCTPLKAF